MRKVNKILYTVTTVLEILLIVGAYLFNYYTEKKLGMVRWVNHNCLKWEKMNPVQGIKLTVIIAVIISLILVIALFIRNRDNCNKIKYAMMAVLIILACLVVGHIVFRDFKHMRAYYFVSLFFLAAYSLQLIKSLVAILQNQHEK